MLLTLIAATEQLVRAGPPLTETLIGTGTADGQSAMLVAGTRARA